LNQAYFFFFFELFTANSSLDSPIFEEVHEKRCVSSPSKSFSSGIPRFYGITELLRIEGEASADPLLSDEDDFDSEGDLIVFAKGCGLANRGPGRLIIRLSSSPSPKLFALLNLLSDLLIGTPESSSKSL